LRKKSEKKAPLGGRGAVRRGPIVEKGEKGLKNVSCDGRKWGGIMGHN